MTTTRSAIQNSIDEIEFRAKLADMFENWYNKYSSVEGVFDRGCKEITTGYLMETKSFDSLREACFAWDQSQLLHITEQGKFILGTPKVLSECEGATFDIERLTYVE